jgi:hypothetical protein
MKRIGTKNLGSAGALARCVVRLAQHTLHAAITGRVFGEAPKRASEALALPSRKHA